MWFLLSGYENQTYTALMNVSFTPSVPTLTETSFRKKCLHIKWMKVSTGLCPVIYLLTFSYGNTTTRLMVNGGGGGGEGGMPTSIVICNLYHYTLNLYIYIKI